MEVMIKKLETHLNAFEIFTIFKEKDHSFFLDSGRDYEGLGRYSFIGLNPYIIIHGDNNEYFENSSCIQGSCLNRVEQLLLENKAENNTELPFIGGCIGFIAYDKTTSLSKVHFVFYDNLIAIDNLYGETFITACGILSQKEDSIEAIEKTINNDDKCNEYFIEESNRFRDYKDCKDLKDCKEYKNYENCKVDDITSQNILFEISDVKKCNKSNEYESIFKSNFNMLEYIKTVGQVKEYIKNGDIYIANLTRKIEANTQKTGYEIYKKLRDINPAPFAAYYRTNDFEIISSSPERFIKIKDRIVETRPIKGTRPRGKTEEEDQKNRQELLDSEKDKAELLMIVDLERNDLSRVCKPNTVKVPELFKLEEYSTVFHLVSTVIGQLKDDETAVTAMETCFPGGSITGAPKIRAMEIINELEGVGRGLYTGCIGYFSFDGNADFNIAIRTIVKQGDTVSFGVGGGITIDSDEEAEYHETVDKAVALMKAIIEE